MLYSILFIAIGIYFLITPAEKLEEKFPKAKSGKLIKGVGVFVLILGILMLLLSLLV